MNHNILGVIELSDVIKQGIKERFALLREMGIKTIMVTGDNPLTGCGYRQGWMTILRKRDLRTNWLVFMYEQAAENWSQWSVMVPMMHHTLAQMILV